MISDYHAHDWASSWIGLPYATGGKGDGSYDCVGLCAALQRERHGREFPGSDWHETDGRPAEGDVLLFRIGGRILHVGYCLGGRDMLHIERNVCSVIEPYTGARWARRMVGVYRFAS